MPLREQNGTKMDSCLTESGERRKATRFQKDWLHFSL